VSTVSFAAPISTDKPRRLLPQWAVTTVRILLAAQGLIAIAVAGLAGALHVVTRYCDVENYCELGDLIVGAIALAAAGYGLFAFAAVRWLRHDRLRGIVALGLALATVGGSAVTALLMRSAATVPGSTYSADAFQLWSAWPLVVWPCVAVIVTLSLGMVFARKPSRLADVVWLVTCAVLSVFFLTYLLPADDSRVAGLHGLGVVRLPQTFDYVFETNGHVTVTRDADPMIIVDEGIGGYTLTLRPGDYSATESCWKTSAGGESSTEIHVPIHVDLGGETVVPNRCPSG
jgi:hypothetical protein